MTRIEGKSTTYHVDHFGIDVLSDDTALGRDVLEHLMKRVRFDLLAPELSVCIIEIKEDTTLVKLSYKQLRTFIWGCFCGARWGGGDNTWRDGSRPMNGARRSISTLSLTTKRLLRCFRGGFPTIGMVSFEGWFGRRPLVVRGGAVFVWWSSAAEWRFEAVCGSRFWSEAGSGLTTTIGGAGGKLSTEDLRSGMLWRDWEEERALLELLEKEDEDLGWWPGGGGGWGLGLVEGEGAGGAVNFFAALESLEPFLLSWKR